MHPTPRSLIFVLAVCFAPLSAGAEEGECLVDFNTRWGSTGGAAFQKIDQPYFWDYLTAQKLSSKAQWDKAKTVERCALYKSHDPKARASYARYFTLRAYADPIHIAQAKGDLKKLEEMKGFVIKGRGEILKDLGTHNPIYKNALDEREYQLSRAIEVSSQQQKTANLARAADTKLISGSAGLKDRGSAAGAAVNAADGEQAAALAAKAAGEKNYKGNTKGSAKGSPGGTQLKGVAGGVASGALASKDKKLRDAKAPPAMTLAATGQGPEVLDKKIEPKPAEAKKEEEGEKPGFFSRAWNWIKSNPLGTALVTGALGAIVGGIAGGGKGALIGAMVGGGLGLGGSMLGRAMESKTEADVRKDNDALVDVSKSQADIKAKLGKNDAEGKETYDDLGKDYAKYQEAEKETHKNDKKIEELNAKPAKSSKDFAELAKLTGEKEKATKKFEAQQGEMINSYEEQSAKNDKLLREREALEKDQKALEAKRETIVKSAAKNKVLLKDQDTLAKLDDQEKAKEKEFAQRRQDSPQMARKIEQERAAYKAGVAKERDAIFTKYETEAEATQMAERPPVASVDPRFPPKAGGTIMLDAGANSAPKEAPPILQAKPKAPKNPATLKPLQAKAAQPTAAKAPYKPRDNWEFYGDPKQPNASELDDWNNPEIMTTNPYASKVGKVHDPKTRNPDQRILTGHLSECARQTDTVNTCVNDRYYLQSVQSYWGGGSCLQVKDESRFWSGCHSALQAPAKK